MERKKFGEMLKDTEFDWLLYHFPILNQFLNNIVITGFSPGGDNYNNDQAIILDINDPKIRYIIKYLGDDGIGDMIIYEKKEIFCSYWNFSDKEYNLITYKEETFLVLTAGD